MSNKRRKTRHSHNELQCKHWVMKVDSFFTQGVTLQTIVNEGRKTHCSHKELRMQTMGNEGRLIVHTRSYNENNG
ncbi:hypothetical protein KSS87_022445 [Heliosperma pusillum]|nr:hypothetical protein KSS87_022445 [Heliosperma pusillum]